MTPALWIPLSLVLAVGIVLALLLSTDNGRRLLNRRSQPVAATERVQALLAAGLLPLSDCPRDRCVVHRLLELGLTPGVELRVVQDNGGPMLVSVRGSRVALGRELADNLWVEMNQKPPAHE